MIKTSFLCLVISLAYAAGEVERVKGGVAAQHGEFRYQVSVQLDGDHVCGGAVISNRHIITAASCLAPIINNPEVLIPKTKILAGTINLKKDGYLLDVARVSVHPEYKYSDLWQSYINDIGIIHLSQEAPRTYWIYPINLPTETEIPEDAELVFTGWGSVLKPVGRSSEILNKVVLEFTPRETCQEYFVDRRIVKSQLCTSANYYVGTCTTDTGSPLVYNNEIIGVSTAFHGCTRGVPDLFTKVSYFLNYIHEEQEIVV